MFAEHESASAHENKVKWFHTPITLRDGVGQRRGNPRCFSPKTRQVLSAHYFFASMYVISLQFVSMHVGLAVTELHGKTGCMIGKT
jgi:hypothetical protein